MNTFGSPESNYVFEKKRERREMERQKERNRDKRHTHRFSIAQAVPVLTFLLNEYIT